jgi:hypothetical protein
MDVTSAMKRNLERRLLNCGMTILNEYRKAYRKLSCADHYKEEAEEDEGNLHVSGKYMKFIMEDED